MFDIAWSEFLVVAVVALVVVGPRDLPGLLRTVGKTVASLRRMAGEFQGQFNEAMREAELDGLKDELTGLKDTASKLTGASPFQIARDELKNALQDKPKPAPSALAGEAPEADAETPPAPSALAPQIEPTPEPPALKDADFAPAPDAARKAAERAAASIDGAAAPKRKAPVKTAADKPAAATKPKAAPKPAAAPKPKAAAKPKPATKSATVKKPKSPGASA